MTLLLLAIGLGLMMLVWIGPHTAYAQITQCRAVQGALVPLSRPRLETLFKEFVRWHLIRQ